MNALQVKRKIPTLIHQIWLGPNKMPESFLRYGRTWKDINPDWQTRLWSEADLAAISIKSVAEKFHNFAARANVYRLWLVYSFGGIYADTDVECLKPFNELPDVDAFAGRQSKWLVCNAVFGAVAGHPWLKWQLENLPFGKPNPWGPLLMTRATRRFPEVVLFPKPVFYPYSWTQRHRQAEQFPGSFAVHHWAGSWRESQKGRPQKNSG
jgi:inositol phosphorylceramide mannosyltransferase catalytic subunit